MGPGLYSAGSRYGEYPSLGYLILNDFFTRQAVQISALDSNAKTPPGGYGRGCFCVCITSNWQFVVNRREPPEREALRGQIAVSMALPRLNGVVQRERV